MVQLAPIAPTPDALTPAWNRFRPHAAQDRLFRSDARFHVVEAGRRSGKTAIMKRRGVLEALRSNPGYRDFLVIFGAPTRDQAKHIYWEDLKAMVPPRLIAGDPREQDLSLPLVNSATIAVVGMDVPKRIEGRPVDWGFYDEFAEYRSDAWAKTIRPCASTPDRPGRVFLYGVPRPSVQFAERALEAQMNLSGEWAYHHWTAASLMDPAEIESARASMDERTFAQEYLASRVNVAGRVYYAFDRSVHMAESLPHKINAPLVLTLDFNVEPGTAAILQEHVEADGHEYTDVLGEIWIPVDSNTERVCRKFVADWGHHQGDVIVDGDPAGGARKTSATDDQTDWTIVRDVLRPVFGERLRIAHLHAAPPVKHRVNALNARLRTANGSVHMRLARGLTSRVAADFDGVQWKQGAAGELEKSKDSTLTHISDGIGYYTARVHPMAGETLTVSTY